ncbi:pyridoxal-phosphate dependent enzyme [Butyrivibrio sp. XB500-5]|uniref:1-aminocyclopropane-1-carboxylate deaminase/D-cysteine desulfhydrase n=1 Tax=Butyrivibrio sp. XB500-5 TaxID=2364880 RepID=UPI000EAA4CA6|nr:pyridoxal-phosphate dependent enzyme [Butyrivibrio sp. XB500-5]RKM59639.1 pyridoxal-phosphate dependent enzyme [Butyrivibrio sp. XB500-5]
MNTGNIKPTPIHKLDDNELSFLYVKREDMIPYSFGGNKARKALLFFEEIDKKGADVVVTYGSSHSNHCRVVANMAAARNIPCIIIGPEEVSDTTYNSVLMELFGAKIITVPIDKVHDTIEAELARLRGEGKNPYFIQGGGHGNIGTESYVRCYKEIKSYEKETGIKFDYIFFATGTGTTQAGLVCGQLMEEDDRHIVGISIARKNPRGRDVVLDSIYEYLDAKAFSYDKSDVEAKTVFIDDYTGDGYGKDSKEIENIIKESMIKYGMPLDATYTGKAFCGMKDYIKKNNLEDKKILFIHTGGTPLFFDFLNGMK